ncbi:MAG: hypothetical protein PHG06_00385 [Parabacteroides sp.]|nr:hypothetical protein [Parabacteroides sp.]
MAGETRIVAGDGTGYYNCDGTDDHIQINLALAWAAANPGNTVYLKGPFTYSIRAQLKIGSSTVWKGDATACVRVANNACGASRATCVFPDGTPVIGALNSSPTGIEITGFEIDGNCGNQVFTLGITHSEERSAGSGVERLIQFSHATDVNIHHMNFHDSFGEAFIEYFGSNIRFHDNVCSNHQHDGVLYKGVTGSGNAIYNNAIAGLGSDCVRVGSSQNVDVYNNTLTSYAGTVGIGSHPKATLNGHNAIQISNESNYTTLTNNITIHDNTIVGPNLCGMWILDARQTAGTSNQTVHVHHNTFTNCGWASGAAWASGIGIVWGNGITIEKNTIDGSYCEGILVYGKITASSTKVTIKNNNISNTLKNRAGSSSYPSVLGYGIADSISTYVTVAASGNYMVGNTTGNYYKVTPSSTATSYITDAFPSGGTDDPDNPVIPDVPVTPTPGIYIPGSTNIIDDDYEEILRDGDELTAYVNYIPFTVIGFSGDGEKTIGESKSPTVAGSNLSDFNFRGANVTFDCISRSIDDLLKVLAAFYRPGRTTIELGVPYKGYKITGVGVSHTTGWNFTKGDVPQNAHPYSLTFKAELPCMELIRKRNRGRYVYNSMQFSADDIYVGNRVKNPSFENWTPNTALNWILRTPAAVNSLECIKYSPELDQYCAVSSSGTNNRIAISDGITWSIPTGLTTATNHDNAWNTLVWCPAWMLWVAMSKSGLTGYSCITSPDGVTWTAKPTPTAVYSNVWECAVFVPPGMDLYLSTSNDYLISTSNDMILTVGNGSELSLGRVIAFSSTGSSRIMYSEDQGANWIFPTVDAAINTHSWKSADYCSALHRIVAVSDDGYAMYSDDYATSWAIVTAPSQKWTCIRWIDTLELFMACSEDGTQQIMTSPTGLSGTWELQDTPYVSSATTDSGGAVVNTLNGITPTGYSYTTKFTDYTTVYTFTLPALSYGHIYRINNVHCNLRSSSSAYTVYMRVLVSSASLGTDVLVKRWDENSTTLVPKSFNIALESATNEEVTIKFVLRTTNATCKAVSTMLGYTASEMTTGGSVITYTRPKLSGLEWANEYGIGVAISNDTTINKTMYTTNGINWTLGDSAAADAWSSMCVSNELGEFMAVSTDGTIMSCRGYGEMKDIAPNNWTLGNTGQSRSSENVIDGLYSLEIQGDGVTAEPGLISQKLAFDSHYDSGETFKLSGQCTVSGLTSGSFRGDIYAGGMVIKELRWEADTDGPIQKDISFRFDTIPTQVYIRVHGSGTPNAGATCFFDDFVVSRYSDFEIAETGSDISTTGYYDVIPDVTIRGIGTDEASASTSQVISKITPDDDTFESTSTSYGSACYTAVLPALTGGSKYRLTELSASFKSSNLLSYTYIKITIQAASLFSGKETALGLYTTHRTIYTRRTYTLPYALESATNETVTLRYYIRCSDPGYRASATRLGYIFKEILNSVVVDENEIYLYNTADPRIILHCCNTVPRGYMAQIKANCTGSYRYVEPFTDDAYISNAYSITGTVARNEENNSLVMSAGSSIVFPFDCLYPVTGIPFIKLFVLSGIPQISIADDGGTGGIPGTFYPIYTNTSIAVENADVLRELDNVGSLRLRGKTKYYVKIEPYSGASCEFSQMLEYASLDTMDAERPYIYSTGSANTFGVVVGGTGKCSAVISLGYHDSNILP